MDKYGEAKRQELLVKRQNEFARLNLLATNGNITLKDSEIFIQLIECMSEKDCMTCKDPDELCIFLN